MVKLLKPPARLSPGEVVMLKNLYRSGMGPLEIAQRTGRSKSKIHEAVKAGGRGVKTRLGRPPALTPSEVSRIMKVLRKMISDAEGCWEVTMAMLMSSGWRGL